MKHHRTTKAFLLLCIFSALTVLVACSGSGAPFGYDIKPDSSTSVMILDDVLDLDSNDFIKVSDDGSYYVIVKK